MDFNDKTLTCRECNKAFIWTAGEQAFYKERGLINVPARCTECRSNRKERLGLQRQPITEVVCANCGTTTTVPFIPRNGKPVYCSTCLSGIREHEVAEESAPVETPAQCVLQPHDLGTSRRERLTTASRQEVNLRSSCCKRL